MNSLDFCGECGVSIPCNTERYCAKCQQWIDMEAIVLRHVSVEPASEDGPCKPNKSCMGSLVMIFSEEEAERLFCN